VVLLVRQLRQDLVGDLVDLVRVKAQLVDDMDAGRKHDDVVVPQELDAVLKATRTL
jgi:hypothetical protein